MRNNTMAMGALADETRLMKRKREQTYKLNQSE